MPHLKPQELKCVTYLKPRELKCVTYLGDEGFYCNSGTPDLDQHFVEERAVLTLWGGGCKLDSTPEGPDFEPRIPGHSGLWTDPWT